MKTNVDFILEASEKFELMSFGQTTTSAQAGDIRQAIVNAGVLGLTQDEKFDVNSKAADIIFGLMDKFGYRGKLFISVKMTPKQQVDLIVESQKPELSAAIKQQFAGPVAAAAKKAGAPAEDILLKNLVMAQNA